MSKKNRKAERKKGEGGISLGRQEGNKMGMVWCKAKSITPLNGERSDGRGLACAGRFNSAGGEPLM